MRNVNLRVVNEILKAIQEGSGQKNLYQLYTKNPRRPGSSKSTVIKYLRSFVDCGLLEQKDGRQIGALKEKVYTLTPKGKKAFQLSRELLTMLED